MMRKLFFSGFWEIFSGQVLQEFFDECCDIFSDFIEYFHTFSITILKGFARKNNLIWGYFDYRIISGGGGGSLRSFGTESTAQFHPWHGTSTLFGGIVPGSVEDGGLPPWPHCGHVESPGRHSYLGGCVFIGGSPWGRIPWGARAHSFPSFE